MKKKSESSLEHRLNRTIGQLEGIKRQVASGEDCLKVLQQLKASIQGLKKFGEAYLSDHFEVCQKSKMTKSEFESQFKELISAAFYL